MPDSLLPAANASMPSTSTAANVAGPSSLNKDKENEKEKGYLTLYRVRRPSPPPRQPSYSKRHASFDSPREVPMPSPSLQNQGGQAELSYFDVPLQSPRSPRKATFTQQSHFSTKDKEKDIFSPVFEEVEDSEWTSVEKPALSLSQNSISLTQGATNPPHIGPSSHLYETYSALGMLPGSSQQIHPFPRPYSLPHNSSSGSSGSAISSGTQTDNEDVNAPRLGRSKTEVALDIYNRDQIGLGKPGWDSFNNVDRSSSASLPLPSQIPYHALPKAGEPHKSDVGRLRGLVSEVAKSRVPESSSEDGNGPQFESNSSSGRSSTDTLPSASHSVSPSPPASHSVSPSPPKAANPPSFRSPPAFSSGTQHNPNIPNIHAFHSHRLDSAYSSSMRSSSVLPNDESRQHLDALVEATAHATALRRRPPSSHSNSSCSPFSQPPEPPIILPPPSPPPNMGCMSSSASQRSAESSGPADTFSPLQHPSPPPKITNPNELPPVLPPSRTRRSVPSDFLSSSGAGTATSSASTSSASSTLSYPGAATLSNSSSSAPGALGHSLGTSRVAFPNSNSPPPYAPFLSHMPPPADSWIEVETTPSEYRLNIRLPGFKRDGITLSTKRRRILHIVADSWPDPDPSPRSSNANPGESSPSHRGGHFERRISFGYDADLVGVRAEFDGEMLNIVVPRRQGMSGAMAPFL